MTLTFNRDGLGVVSASVEDRRGQGAVVVEYFGSLLREAAELIT
jgi:hypothetical protein